MKILAEGVLQRLDEDVDFYVEQTHGGKLSLKITDGRGNLSTVEVSINSNGEVMLASETITWNFRSGDPEMSMSNPPPKLVNSNSIPLFAIGW